MLAIASCLNTATGNDAAADAFKVASPVMPPGVKPDGSGLVVNILTHLFDRAGVQLSLIVAPARRSIADADAGLVDGVVAPYPDLRAEYGRLRVLEEPLFPVELAGMYLDESVTIDTLEDFFDYRVAFLRGWKRAEALFSGHDRVEMVRTPRRLLEMLAQRRVDVIFFSTVPARHLARDMQAEYPELSDLETTRYRSRQHLYLHLNARHDALLPVLDSALSTMKSDGTMETLLVDYALDF